MTRTRTKIFIIGLTPLLLLLTSCAPEVEIPTPPAAHTLLVYMAGDNNLSLETTQKIKAIAKGFHDTDNHLLIYQDYNHTTLTTPSPTPVLLKLEATGAHTPARIDTVMRYAHENSASAAVFGRVLTDVATHYPATTHGLLLFSHGTGWLPKGTFLHPRSITVDTKNEMELSAMAAAIPDGHFEYIIFEACLMAGVEVAYELRTKTNYLVASSAEIISPGFTPIYPQIIPYLFEPTPNLIAFTAQFHAHVSALSGLYRSSTMSVIATQALETLKQQVLPVLAQTNQPQLTQIQEYNRNAPLLYFDLDHYMKLAASPAQYRQFEQTLNIVVPYKAATPSFVGTPIKHHGGLTIYLRQTQYPYLNSQHATYQFMQ